MEAGGLATVDDYWYALSPFLYDTITLLILYTFVELCDNQFFLNLPSKVSLKQEGMVLLIWSKTVVFG